MKYRAAITGVSGQDGAYLSQLLLDQGCEAIGLVRHGQSINALWRLKSCRILEDFSSTSVTSQIEISFVIA